MTRKTDTPGDALPEHVAENRMYWDGMADAWVSAGERSWRSESPFWGIWGIPESRLQILPEDMHGMDSIELGCGTGYVSCWMVRRGARAVGIDNSSNQLATANRLMEEYGLSVSWIHGNAEKVPCPDESFDFAISEYGAAIWCDPYVWVPEAHRLLRPGGGLTFLGNHPLSMLCTPENGAECDDQLHRAYFGMHLHDWRNVDVDPGGMEFNLTHSDWLRLFRETGFEVVDYIELGAPADATEDKFGIPLDWAKKWPSEHVWKLRKPL